MDIFVGNVISVGFNFTPVGFLPCDGRVIPISSYETLYTLIGTTYGGDGVTTFGIPDLQSRVPIHMGHGPSLSNYVLGQKGGTATTTLLPSNLPPHTHGTSLIHMGVNTAGAATLSNPALGYLANADPSIGNIYTNSPDYPYQNATISLSTAGSSIPIDIVNPYLAINYVIATQGVFPSQG